MPIEEISGGHKEINWTTEERHGAKLDWSEI